MVQRADSSIRATRTAKEKVGNEARVQTAFEVDKIFRVTNGRKMASAPSGTNAGPNTTDMQRPPRSLKKIPKPQRKPSQKQNRRQRQRLQLRRLSLEMESGAMEKTLYGQPHLTWRSTTMHRRMMTLRHQLHPRRGRSDLRRTPTSNRQNPGSPTKSATGGCTHEDELHYGHYFRGEGHKAGVTVKKSESGISFQTANGITAAEKVATSNPPHQYFPSGSGTCAKVTRCYGQPERNLCLSIINREGKVIKLLVSGDIPYLKVGSRSCNPQSSPLAEKIYEFINSLDLEAYGSTSSGEEAAPGEDDDDVDLRDVIFGSGEPEEHHGSSADVREEEGEAEGMNEEREEEADEAGERRRARDRYGRRKRCEEEVQGRNPQE